MVTSEVRGESVALKTTEAVDTFTESVRRENTDAKICS